MCFDEFILFHVKVLCLYLYAMLYSSHYHAHVVSECRGQKYLINNDLDYGLYLAVSMTTNESVWFVVLKKSFHNFHS